MKNLHRGAAGRVLVIAYDFPPHAAIGTMRTLRLVRHLHDQGWQVTVLTASPDTYLPGTPVERALEAQVPAGVEVLQVRAVRPFTAFESLVRRVRSPRPSQPDPAPARRDSGAARGPERRSAWLSALIKVRDRVEALLDMPDKESGWIMPAVVRGIVHMLRNGRPDVIYSSAPPWSGQVIALCLVRLARRPWIADFRDPWARAPWRDWQLGIRRRAVASLERRVVTRADTTLFVTEANRADFAALYGPALAGRFQLVPNGCDPTELEALAPLPARDRFVLLHAGTFYGPRSPMPVIHAIAHAVRRGALDPRTFRLRLLGTIQLPVDVPAECARLGLADVVEFVPRVTRAESLREMKSASALLLVQIDTLVSIPAKAYEYLASGRPVLALAEGETASLVRASGIGVAVRPNAPVEEVEAALLAIVGIAGRPFAPAAATLYDGRVHAATVGSMLANLARTGGDGPITSRRGVAAAPRVVPEEPRR